MTSQTQKMDEFLDDLGPIVDGDREAIARHADFLADDDEARDLRHEASGVALKLANAGADYVPPSDLEARLFAALDARAAKDGGESFERKTNPGFLVDPASPVVMPASSVPVTQAMPAVSLEAVRPSTDPYAETQLGVVLSPAVTAPPAIAPIALAPVAQTSNVIALDASRKTETSTSTPRNSSKLGRVILLFGGFATVAVAAAAGVFAIGNYAGLGVTSTTHTTEMAAVSGTTGRILSIVRAGGSADVSGIEVRPAGGVYAAALANAEVPAGASIRTDTRTRVRLSLSDGSQVVLNHGTELAFDAANARQFTLAAGELLADIQHLEQGPRAHFHTPTGDIEVVGTKFVLAATSEMSSVRVTRGKVQIGALAAAPASYVPVDQGEEGVLRANTAPRVSPAMDLARAVAWADFGDQGSNANVPVTPEEETSIPGIGSLRARRPGEREDRERPLAVSRANVRVRITGNIARTEIEQVFQNDSADQLEGIYRFPLPPDARIARLALDVNGELEEGSFVARNRAQRIWRGVIRNATPVLARRPTEDFIWVPGRWRDPALLEWQRGGNFELRIFPIPAQGSRRVVLAYTQIVHPHGDERRYVYPLPVSRDGSTRIGELNIDVRVAGAETVRSAGYEVTSARENDTTTLSYQAHDFVPNGDLVIDYGLPGAAAELTSWTYQGQAATAPPENSRDQDREVIDAQRQVAADGRGYVTFALRPQLPASAESRPSDYIIVVDSSQSMVGERFTRASRLVTGVLSEMDRRDRFTVLACDYECRSLDGGGNATRALRTPSSDEVRAVSEWLGHVEPAGASDLGASLRAAAHLPGRDAARDVHVLYIGDGVASAGHRTAGALAEEAAQIATHENVTITTVGIGGDADTVALSAMARAGGGHYVPYVPGERASTAALAVLETTYGVSLEDASYTLPAGLVEAAPSELPTVRAGEEVMIVARMTQPNVTGDVVLRGTVGGQPFEHRYPVALTPSTSAGNLFVPAQWAAGTIEELELAGRGSDEARIVALSKAYSVMSRHTSLLVLESDAMFRAFGIDRSTVQTAAWTGEEAAESSESAIVAAFDSETESDAPTDILAGGAVTDGESANLGSLGLTGSGLGGGGTGQGFGRTARSRSGAGDTAAPTRRESNAPAAAAPPAPRPEESRADTTAMRSPARITSGESSRQGPGRWMRRVFVRVGEVSASSEITFREQEAARVAEQALQMAPDSRDRHRAAVRALSRAGNVSRALEVAEAWITRDRLDPEALIARADLLARSGHADEALRVLTGVVDLRPDDALLQERLVNAFQRAGREDRSCAHRVALAEIDTANVDRMGAALRCERALGRSSMASILLQSVRETSARERAERVASNLPTPPRTRGDLMVEASWPGGDDIDISLIAPDGSRISWMGGRTNVVALGPMSAGSESLGLRTATAGSYQIEVTRRGEGTHSISGQLRVRALDSNRTIPFTISSGRSVVGRATVRREAQMQSW